MKKITALLLAMVMGLSLVACGSSEPAPAPETETPTVENVTLNVAYMPNWGSLWAVATADAKGYFAEEGITVKMTAFENGPTEIAAMESGAMDVAFIGPGAHKLCSTGAAEVFLLQHVGDGDCIIGLNGIKTIEELKGKKIGYSAGTSSESILLEALKSAGMTMDDVEALSMDDTALTTAALSGSVDAVAAWSPFSLTILANAKDATDICSNIDFESMASPGSWVVNPKWADENDVRVTRIGKYLRAFRLDEILQFVNSLRGEISIIGPRPEREIFHNEFCKIIKDWDKRLMVKGGITGLAQVNGGYDLSPAEKLVYDLEYIENRSIWLDIKILWKTVLVVFSHNGAR